MFDLAIVGAGAAGIAAATEARARGLSCVVLEASPRVGGRAETTRWRGHALDLGAGWLHSAERNPMRVAAERIGQPVDRSPSPWREQFRDLGFGKDEQAAANAAAAAFEARIAAVPPASDVAADALEPGGPWNGFLDALSGYLNGAALKQVSARDYAAWEEAASDNNWRLTRGYGTLVETLAEDLDVRTGVAVRAVDRSGTAVNLLTDTGAVAAARAVVAVPTTMLASEAIRFAPDVDAHRHAAAQLPLGHVEKHFFTLPDPATFPKDAHLLGNPHHSETGSYMLRPLGMPVIECFFGGDWLPDAAGLDALAREQLGALLGSGFARAMEPVAASDWRGHAFIRGSYSFARPGAQEQRRRLAEPVDERLAFAGEALSTSDYATVHGAWQSGREAVRRLMEAE
ncbi:FAD-dependent oxidoreductase [Sphingomonas ginkgonis]|uniref:Tryptophan 2-monooxygenase n=1 Tax=Sphingomonas ginkgonis TaxID=2315330 RepID=A0A429VCP0_9SPHN|nr:FAD-dependent oxidoreductase [Sphingomonas ginkgonis]RST31765.1 FAD-dependent oxidoreductase [Sphingomonas ginkgonis]